MRVLIRADASTRIGTGHVLRCLALAQALIDSGDEVRMHACEMPEALAERVRSEGVEVSVANHERGSKADLKETIARAKGWADAVVLDGYEFNRDFQASIRNVGPKLLVVDDDTPGDHYIADILLNQNLHAKQEMYNGSQVANYLLGPKYTLLRREFREQPVRETSARTRRVLITLGGSDPDNVTKKLISSFKRITLTGIEARVLVGGSNPHLQSLEDAALKPGGSVEILTGVTNMREQYEWADIAIAAGGSTAWELAFMGLPCLMIILVDNQEKIAKSVWRAGTGLLLGWHNKVKEEQIAKEVRDLLVSTENRDRMTRWAQGLVDGKGAMRVAEALREAIL